MCNTFTTKKQHDHHYCQNQIQILDTGDLKTIGPTGFPVLMFLPNIRGLFLTNEGLLCPIRSSLQLLSATALCYLVK